jgi:hypothetical protein
VLKHSRRKRRNPTSAKKNNNSSSSRRHNTDSPERKPQLSKVYITNETSTKVLKMSLENALDRLPARTDPKPKQKFQEKK